MILISRFIYFKNVFQRSQAAKMPNFGMGKPKPPPVPTPFDGFDCEYILLVITLR